VGVDVDGPVVWLAAVAEVLDVDEVEGSRIGLLAIELVAGNRRPTGSDGVDWHVTG
jgi:hypothetical protein